MDALPHAGMTSDDDEKKHRRREQNRLSAQRSYHKKQERLQALRAQVSQLETTYERQVSTISTVPSSPGALLAIPPGSASSSAASSPASSVDGGHGKHGDEMVGKSDAISPSSPPAGGPLQHLLASRSQLQSENDALRRRIDDHTRFQFRLQSLAAGEEAAASETTLTRVLNSTTGSPRFQPRIQMKRPLSVEECYEIGRTGYQNMSAYKFPENYMTTGSSLCGWTDKRVLENGLVKVQLRKVFHGLDTDSFARNGWAAVQDPRKMDALYSLNMNFHSEIVQRIDDNNLVMYQSYETPERDASGKETGAIVVMHHVMLLTMFATEEGYYVMFCSLEPDRLDDSDHIVDLAEEEEAVARGFVKRRRKQWFKKFSWLSVNRVGDASECTYLFTVPPHHGANFYWPLEIMLLILRFEVAAVGPVFTLPSSDDEPMLESRLAVEDDDDDLDDEHVMIQNAKVKMEPLTHSVGDEDLGELFIELFP